MPELRTFRCTGRDRYLGHERVWYVCATSEAAARQHIVRKGLLAPVIEAVDQSLVPADATVLLVRSGDDVAGAGRTPRVLQRVLLVLLGVALGLFAIGGYLFVNKAKEHLLRERGRTPPGAAVPAK